MKKQKSPSSQPEQCKGNLTCPGRKSQLHGAYQFQAITPNPGDGRTAAESVRAASRGRKRTMIKFTAKECRKTRKRGSLGYFI